MAESTTSSKPEGRHTLAAAATYFGSISMGMVLGYPAAAGTSLRTNHKDISMITFSAMIPLGAVFGTLLSAYLSKLVGRRPLLALSVFLYVAAWIAVMVSWSNVALYIGIFLVGLVCGLVSLTTPMYIHEVSPHQKRGQLGSGHHSGVALGILLSFLVGDLFTNLTKLTPLILAGCCILPSVILSITMWFAPETPTWLVATHKPEVMVKRSIQVLHGNTAFATKEIARLNTPSLYSTPSVSLYSDLKTESVYKPLAISMMLMLFQQLTGINGIIFNAKDIFTGLKGITPETATVLLGVVHAVSSLPASYLADKMGRKRLMQLSGVIQVIALLTLGGAYLIPGTKLENEVTPQISWIAVIALLVYIMGYSIGHGPVPWIMMNELLPHNSKEATTGASASVNWMCAFLVTEVFNAMIKNFGETTTYCIFAAVALTSIAFVQIFVPETSGKTIEELEKLFKTIFGQQGTELMSTEHHVINDRELEESTRT